MHHFRTQRPDQFRQPPHKPRRLENFAQSQRRLDPQRLLAHLSHGRIQFQDVCLHTGGREFLRKRPGRKEHDHGLNTLAIDRLHRI